MASGEKLEKDEVRARCVRSLCHHGLAGENAANALGALAAGAPKDAKTDRYGAGDLVQGFEREIAALLGKEAALFFPSGTMAQQVALRIWCDRRGCRNVALHPKCHLEVHEHRAYQRLHGLDAVLVGGPNELIGLEHLEGVGERLGALLLELPQRDLGGRLPSWDALNAQCAWARSRGVPLHLDGARLWESGPFYGRSYAEIAGLFGSVYVSFYKGLGALAGAALAGPADFIAEARVWRRRHGGALPALYPYVLSAKLGLAARLDKMGAYHARAIAIAARLAEVPLVDVTPRPPDTNMMHVYLRGERARLERAALEVASETRTFLFGALEQGPLPKLSYFELTVGDATMEIPVDEVGELIGDVVDRAMA